MYIASSVALLLCLMRIISGVKMKKKKKKKERRGGGGGCFFFFQAEDGIRDRDVTGVQTCALRSLPVIIPMVL